MRREERRASSAPTSALHAPPANRSRTSSPTPRPKKRDGDVGFSGLSTGLAPSIASIRFASARAPSPAPCPALSRFPSSCSCLSLPAMLSSSSLLSSAVTCRPASL
eukprot:655042-Rhodomonas_salina.3